MTETETIRHELELEASPHEVYQALISSEQHSAFTGAPAEFTAKEGGEFSTFDGAIVGSLTKLDEDKRIEMDWRASGFPEGYFTKVTFELVESSKGTKIKFTHSGVPSPAKDMITEGWNTNYWDKLPEYLSSNS